MKHSKWHGHDLIGLKSRVLLRRVVCGLPLAGVFAVNILVPLTARMQQFLVMITLLWFQVFILFEVFWNGK